MVRFHLTRQKEKTMNKQEEKVLTAVAKATFENVEMPEEQYDMIQKINKIYHDTLQKYMNAKVVVEFNFLEFLKTQTVGITTKKEFESVLLTIIETMKQKNRSQTENYEYALARKIYRDVVKGQGQNYELDKIKVDFDGQPVEFSPFKLLTEKDDFIQ